ncbi:MAG: ATP-binding cassette domain-containing protein [Erysipelotrichaceae bacterium]|nr:ATP-binding cassette domain-containing protein [Erysipelotrichaceae bacterium]
MIRIENLTKSFKNDNSRLVALNNVSASIDKGELVGIIGSSGAGKSTLIRQLSLIEQPDSGTIWLDDVDLFKLKGQDLLRMRRQLGIVFQGYHLLEQKNVYDNIAFPLQLVKMDKADIKKRVEELISLVGLNGKAQAYPVQLSGGQKQRVAIARALASSPTLLLCDEPTSALDVVTTKSILDLLVEIHRKTQVTIVIITHELSVVKAVCQRVIVMNEGYFVEDGSVKQVFASPKHEMTKLLLSYQEGQI